MALGLLAAGLGSAMSGAAGGMMGEGDISTPEYLPEQKPFMRAAQASIPLYLSVLTGGQPLYMKRYLQQIQSQLQGQTGRNVQDYLRQYGMRGADFGPAAAAGLSNIYSTMTPAMGAALAQARSGITGQALKQMGTWSMMQPGGMSQPSSPSPGRMAAAGALQGVGRGLGGLMGGAGGNGGAKKTAPAQPATQQPSAANLQGNYSLTGNQMQMAGLLSKYGLM